MAFLVCCGLLLTHTYFMITNTTTWEKFSRRNITYLRTIKDETLNPFHESYCKNISQFCCNFKTIEWESIYLRYSQSCGGVSQQPRTTPEHRINMESSEWLFDSSSSNLWQKRKNSNFEKLFLGDLELVLFLYSCCY